MEVNERLVLETANHIRRSEGKNWDQADFESKYGCKTTRCFAGWAVAIVHGFPDSIYWIGYADRLHKLTELNVSTIDPITGVLYSRDYLMNSALYAQLLLGLNDKQASKIFYDTTEDLSLFLKRVQRITGVDLALSDPVTPMGTVERGDAVSVQSKESIFDHSGRESMSTVQDDPDPKASYNA